MVRYAAFLRGINVGSHTVKMDSLRLHFEELGLAEVSTLIASGNVVFASENPRAKALEEQIEQHLQERLGYAAATFLRTSAELDQVVDADPFPDVSKEGTTLYVAFLRTIPDRATRDRALALSQDDDLLHVQGRELYWLRRGRFSDSVLSGRILEKALGAPTTIRNVSTVRKIAVKCQSVQD